MKKKIVKDIKKKAKTAIKEDVKKHPIRWILIAIVIVATVFILTPTNNPLSNQLKFDSVGEELAIPAYTKDDIVVQRTGYTLCYNEEHEQPSWVAYVLTADEVFTEGVSRKDNFREDPEIPTGSATLSDYKGSGYDRGHLAPSADLTWSFQSMNDSFYLSNMSPQTHEFNAGIWLSLESAVRTMAAQNQEICVVTGPVLTDGPYKTIGDNKVSVPNSFYKVILDYYGDEKKAIGFILAQDTKGELSNFAVSVDEVEFLTGIDFFPNLPDNEEKALESTYDPSLWDLRDFDRKKTAKRYGYDLTNASYNADSVVTERKPENAWESVRYFMFTHFAKYKIKVIAFVKGIF